MADRTSRATVQYVSPDARLRTTHICVTLDGAPFDLFVFRFADVPEQGFVVLGQEQQLISFLDDDLAEAVGRADWDAVAALVITLATSTRS